MQRLCVCVCVFDYVEISFLEYSFKISNYLKLANNGSSKQGTSKPLVCRMCESWKAEYQLFQAKLLDY